MKWLYLILAIAMLLLGAIQLIGPIGYWRGWWQASPDTAREGIVWAVVFLGLSAAGFARWRWYVRRARASRGFPIDP